MLKNIQQKSWFWAIAFGILLLLSLDYWAWQNPIVLGLGGFPTWLFYFLVLQAVFVGVIWLFTKLYWKE